MHDSREAWSLSRQLARHGRGRAMTRVPPAANLISVRQWEQHIARIWDGTVDTGLRLDQSAQNGFYDPPL